MASIYTLDGETITVGLQGCDMCDEAIIVAERIADRRKETVMLDDDDGEWCVYPAGEEGTRRLATLAPSMEPAR